jgi:hypothetical protein
MMRVTGTGFIGDPSPSWQELKFNGMGLSHLRQKLGDFNQEPGVFQRYQHAFEAADIAWFAANLHNDGQHLTPMQTFHPMFHAAREHSPSGEQGTRERNALREKVRTLIFDLVCLASQPSLSGSSDEFARLLCMIESTVARLF